MMNKNLFYSVRSLNSSVLHACIHAGVITFLLPAIAWGCNAQHPQGQAVKEEGTVQIGKLAIAKDSFPFQYIRTVKERNHARSKIEFFDSLTNQRVKTVDVAEWNPFGKFREKVVEYWDYYGTPIYELDTSRVIEMIDSIEPVSKRHHYDTPNLTPFRLMSQYVISTQGRNYIAVLYELSTLNKGGRNISSHSTIFIFDRKGNLVRQTPLWDVNGGRPTITDDGRFVMFQTGGPHGWEQAGYVPDHLRVYDTHTDMTYIDGEMTFEPTELIDGKLFLTAMSAEGGRKIIFYDFYNLTKYKKTFPLDELPKQHSVSSKGFMFTNAIGEPYLKYSLENDFAKSKITVEK